MRHHKNIKFIFIISLSILLFVNSGFQGNYPSGCDTEAALQCEYDFLICKLFEGPANDQQTLCKCASIFYGVCLRLAGCETSKEVGPLTAHEIYMKTCVDFIIANNCPDPLICGFNCASDTKIDVDVMKVMPFNNYGQDYLRIRTCIFKVHTDKLARYSTIEQKACGPTDFIVCSRFIPPNTYAPVGLNINTTYIEIDSCKSTGDTNPNLAYNCSGLPVRIYGNQYVFPLSYDVPQTDSSICSSDGDCLGSFCDSKYHPSICSPKTIKQVRGAGANYMQIG